MLSFRAWLRSLRQPIRSRSQQVSLSTKTSPGQPQPEPGPVNESAPARAGERQLAAVTRAAPASADAQARAQGAKVVAEAPQTPQQPPAQTVRCQRLPLARCQEPSFSRPQRSRWLLPRHEQARALQSPAARPGPLAQPRSHRAARRALSAAVRPTPTIAAAGIAARSVSSSPSSRMAGFRSA